ncbi:MAG TPA: exodeoxyribonuclease VII large subunit [Candidatus Acidoferrales bacterium]|nr:exodeoxyribonuclease VII large subunit [Candidatus Acidoferrales bacterium]
MTQFSLNLIPEKHVWRVSELTLRICDLLENEFPDLWVEGEVSNFRAAQSGHFYFTLKDEKAQIRCVCFRDQVRGLKFRPEDGLRVTVRGSVSVYEPRGEYQIYVSHIEPVGLGALQLAFEQLKKTLEAEGLFAAERKRPLPALPRLIGIVSSPQGAAIRDILRVLRRRFPNLHVLLYPVKVQGEGAAEEIVRAIRHFNRAVLVDVMIVARGGGSFEDLWAFNEEIVVRAIAASEIPIITGIGHETDTTISDFAADLRAPTPSAAAEIVVRTRAEFEKHISDCTRQLVQHMRYLFLEKRHRLRDLAMHRAFRRPEDLVRRSRQRLDDMNAALAAGLRGRLDGVQQRMRMASARMGLFDLRGRVGVTRIRVERRSGELRAALDRAVTRKRRRYAAVQVRIASLDLRAHVSQLRRKLERDASELTAHARRYLVATRRKLEAATVRLEERSPFQLLERGYAIAYDANGRVLRSAEQVAAGDDIAVRLARGEIAATVRTKKESAP